MPPRADPSAGEQLGAARHRQAGILRHRVGPAVGAAVPENEGVDFAALHLEAGLHEGGLAALIGIVEIDQSGLHPWIVGSGDEVEMVAILLAWPVAQDLERLALVIAGPA